MKQENANKLLAIFMAAIMLFSIAAYFLSAPPDTSKPRQETQSDTTTYNPEFWTINEPFYSISDALKMTPDNVTTAQYVDLEGMTPQMEQWARGQGLPIQDLDTKVYKTTTKNIYYTTLGSGENRSFMVLSTMFPEKNDFEYMVSPNLYGYHYILLRQEQQYNGFINVMGTPTLLAPLGAAIGVLEIITSLNKSVTAYDRYDELLNIVEPAPFQIINSTVDFADTFYFGIRDTNGSYERTTAYMNINRTLLTQLEQQKTNSTERGFSEYNITSTGNYTVVRIMSPELQAVLDEETS
jgi:hypothetical protein